MRFVYTKIQRGEIIIYCVNRTKVKEKDARKKTQKEKKRKKTCKKHL